VQPVRGRAVRGAGVRLSGSAPDDLN